MANHWTTLVSIILGLGMADLLVNLHRLIHARARVDWDALPLAWAAIALCWMFNYWWAVGAGLDGAPNARVVGHYVLLAINPIVLFLLSASILPRSLPATGRLDMRAEWDGNRTTCLYLFALNQLVTWCMVIAARGGVFWDFPATTRTVTLVLVVAALVFRSRRVEWGVVAVIAAFMVARLATQAVR